MRFKRGFSALLLAVAVVALDRATKHWAMRTLAQPVVAIEGVLRWRYCENTGAAFSALSGSGTVVLVLSAVCCGVVAYLLFRPGFPGGPAVPVGGGCWGRFHLFDRLAWALWWILSSHCLFRRGVQCGRLFYRAGRAGRSADVLLDREGAK